jgi:thiol:disulfide interchange protein DsbD
MGNEAPMRQPSGRRTRFAFLITAGSVLALTGYPPALPGGPLLYGGAAGFPSQSVIPFLASPVPQAEDQVVEVKTLLSRDGVRPGETVKAAVILKIQAGYHINNDLPADPFLVPTTLAFDENPGAEILEVIYPPGHHGRFAYTQAELVVYEGEAILGALIKVHNGLVAGPLKLKATLSYQACDNSSCLPPKDLRFEVSVPVVAAGKECHDVHSDIFEKIAFSAKVK